MGPRLSPRDGKRWIATGPLAAAASALGEGDLLSAARVGESRP
jgi:hypothetical protein